MAERVKNMRQLLIEAGIEEINRAGVTEFSVRRVATACGVSCAAPYKHFKDRQDFICSIIEYVNEQWRDRQDEILFACTGGLRQQIVELIVGYVCFLVEKPFFRPILLLNNGEYNNLYHKARGQMSSRSQLLQKAFFRQSGWDAEKFERKLHIVRSILFGTVFLLDAGELEFSERLIQNIREMIDREFDLP